MVMQITELEKVVRVMRQHRIRAAKNINLEMEVARVEIARPTVLKMAFGDKPDRVYRDSSEMYCLEYHVDDVVFYAVTYCVEGFRVNTAV